MHPLVKETATISTRWVYFAWTI